LEMLEGSNITIEVPNRIKKEALENSKVMSVSRNKIKAYL